MLFRIAVLTPFLQIFLFASSLITPLPQQMEYDRNKALLGKKLFKDTRLSKDDTISCESCHRLGYYGVDGAQFSTGVLGKIGNVNAPTVYNSVFNIAQFWDGRARNLEEQATGPIHNPVEMDSSMEVVIAKLKKDTEYVNDFYTIYGREIDEQGITDAIAEFEKALITPNSKFDRYLRGEKNALDIEEQKGYEVFKNSGCISCHNGINIGGNIYQRFGVFKEYDNHSNKGRYNVTKNEEDMYYFKVPSLRNISKTAPYFHDGSAETLQDAIKIMVEHQLGLPLDCDEIEYLHKFLLTLEGEIPEIAQ